MSQAEQCAVNSGIEYLVAVAFLDHLPVCLEDGRRRVLRVVPVSDTHAEIAVPQRLDQVVVVLQPLFLGQAKQVVHGGDLRFRPSQGTASRQQTGQHRCCQQLLPSVFHRVSPFKSAVPNITGVKGLFLHSSGEHRKDNTNFLQLYGEISYRFLTVAETTKRSASFGSRTFYVSSITPRGRWRRWGRCRCRNRSPGKRQHR